MLVNATIEDIEKYGEFVYNIALDQSKSCYPTYTDGIKTKEAFFEEARKSITKDNFEMLLFFYENRMEGWIQYFWIEKDHYLQLSGCNINVATAQALMELMVLLEARFKGYSLYFGFPKTNAQAVDFLLENGFECIEEAYNNSFFFETYGMKAECKAVKTINRENFVDFRCVDGQSEEDTYWNCDRIFENIDNWKIFVYYENEIPIGTIFFSGAEGYLEIFGVEFVEGKYSKESFTALMIAALNEGKKMGAKYLTFFSDAEVQTNERQSIIEELGFCYVGQYVCYMKTI